MSLGRDSPRAGRSSYGGGCIRIREAATIQTALMREATTYLTICAFVASERVAALSPSFNNR
jgi:hypothetical protein